MAADGHFEEQYLGIDPQTILDRQGTGFLHDQLLGCTCARLANATNARSLELDMCLDKAVFTQRHEYPKLFKVILADSMVQ
jgi:hypothetical protein